MSHTHRGEGEGGQVTRETFVQLHLTVKFFSTQSSSGCSLFFFFLTKRFVELFTVGVWIIYTGKYRVSSRRERMREKLIIVVNVFFWVIFVFVIYRTNFWARKIFGEIFNTRYDERDDDDNGHSLCNCRKKNVFRRAVNELFTWEEVSLLRRIFMKNCKMITWR